MPKCKECDQTFPIMELKERRLCKSCTKKLFPVCPSCQNTFPRAQMVGELCSPCYEAEQERLGLEAKRLAQEEERLAFAASRQETIRQSAQQLGKQSVKSVFVYAGIDRGYLVDGKQLAEEIETNCNDLLLDGYQVISILPVTSGHTEEFFRGGAGFGFTSGVVITAITRL